MKIGACTLAYNDEGTIAGTLGCLQDFVDKHIVLISEKPYFGEVSKPDSTEEICNNFEVDVIKGNWKLDNYQRNLGNKMCSDCDWVLGFDSDEMMTTEDLVKLIVFLETTNADAVCTTPEVYWHDTDHILSPRATYSPVIAMRPHVKFTYIRNIDCIPVLWNEGTLHHISWGAPKDILKKVRHYAHATDFNGDIWYKTHYENWQEGDWATLPDRAYPVIKCSLPTELEMHLYG